jgi:hypothetical protein
MSKTFGEMTPEERRAAMRRVAGRLQTELQAAAPEISRIMDGATQAEPDPDPAMVTVEIRSSEDDSLIMRGEFPQYAGWSARRVSGTAGAWRMRWLRRDGRYAVTTHLDGHVTDTRDAK